VARVDCLVVVVGQTRPRRAGAGSVARGCVGHQLCELVFHWRRPQSRDFSGGDFTPRRARARRVC